MLKLSEFLNKVLVHHLEFAIVDPRFDTKYGFSKNIFSRYNEKSDSGKEVLTTIAKYAAQCLKKIIIQEMFERKDVKEDLLKYLISFLSPKEKEIFANDTEMIVSISISKFVNEKDIDHIYDVDVYNLKMIEKEKSKYALKIFEDYKKAISHIDKFNVEIALMYSEKCINTINNALVKFEHNTSKFIGDYKFDFMPINVSTAIKYLKDLFKHELNSDVSDLCFINLKIVVRWFLNDYMKTDIVIDNVNGDLKSFKECKLKIHISQTSLVVIRAITEVWSIEKFLREYKVEINYKNIVWSDKLLKSIDANNLQVGIYNTNRIKKYMEENKENNLDIVSKMCYSMGGRNFYMLAKENSIWHKMSFKEVKENLNNSTICLPLGSDMHENFLNVFDLTDVDIKEKNIILIDTPVKIGLEIFNMCPNALLVSGQNIRYQALYRKGYIEAIDFLTIPKNKKSDLKKASSNSLVVNKSIYNYIDRRTFKEIIHKAKGHFSEQWLDIDLYDKNLESIKNICDQSDLSDDENYYMIKNILFETYRFGDLIL